MWVYRIIQKEFLKILGVQSQDAIIHIIMKGKRKLRNCTENSIQWTHFMGRWVKCIFKKCATRKRFKNLDRRRLHHLNGFLEDKRLFRLRQQCSNIFIIQWLSTELFFTSSVIQLRSTFPSWCLTRLRHLQEIQLGKRCTIAYVNIAHFLNNLRKL